MSVSGTRPTRPSWRSGALAALGVLALVLGTVAGGVLLAGTATAGDAVAQFALPESGGTGTPGETVEVEVWLDSDGGYAGEGLASYEFVVAVPPEVGAPVDAEPGPWLEGGGGEVEQTTADAGPGALWIRHERVGTEDGVTGWDRAATVTVELREDAPAANASVLIADPDAALATSDFPMRSFGANATLVVDGGGERLEPAYDPADDDPGGVNVTTAEDANRSVPSGDAAESEEASSEEGGEEDAVPGFGLAAALLAVVLTAAVARR